MAAQEIDVSAAPNRTERSQRSIDTVSDAGRVTARRLADQIAGRHLGSAWMFGSRARGDHRHDSDWDIAVVVSPDADWQAIENALRDAAAEHWSRTGERFQFHVVSVSNIRHCSTIARAVEQDRVRL